VGPVNQAVESRRNQEQLLHWQPVQ